MKYRSGLAAFLVSMCAAIPALAQDESEGSDAPPVIEGTPFYFSAMGSYLLADKDRGIEDGLGGTAILGKRLTTGLHLELAASYLQADAEQRPGLASNGTLKLSGLGVNAMLFPFSSTAPGAYLVFGVGAGEGKGHPGLVSDYKTTYFDAGVGYMQPVIANWLLLRAEARYHMDKHTEGRAGVQTPPKDNGTFYDALLNVGFVVPFGGASSTEEPAAEEAAAEEAAPAEGEAAAAAPTDSDGDGVPDDSDKCPDTAAGAVVNAEGCSDDADGDGVADASDECPNTPAGAKVLANGCTLKDDCRTPNPGEKVDENGCAVGGGLILRGVNFEFDSERLTDTAKGLLDESSGTLKNYADIKVEVAGHTDNVGTAAYNQGLSERRANSVRNYLVGTGIDNARMSSSGYGTSQPIDTNDTDEGRAKNRRVELRPIQEESAAIAVPAGTETAPVETAPEAAPNAATLTDAPAEESAPAETTEAAPSEPAAEETAAPAEESAPAEEATPAEPAAESAPATEEPAAEAAPAEESGSTEMVPDDSAVEMAPMEAPPSEEVPAETQQ